MSRRGVRVAYGVRLESVCSLTGTGGSNPPFSAILLQHRAMPKQALVNGLVIWNKFGTFSLHNS